MKIFKKNSKLYLIPIIFAITIVPLIVYLKKVELGSFLAQYWTSDTNMDFFSYHKSMWLIGTTLLGLVSFSVYLSKGNKFKKTKYYIPIGIYLFFTILSSFLSDTPFVAFLGFPDRYEGVFILLSYMILMVIAINIINDKKAIKIVIVALLLSALILGIQGVFQYFGMDFYQSNFGKHLILPRDKHNLVNNLNFKFDKQIIYSTMFNPNYVGSYTAMLFSLTMALYILVKRHKYKVMLGVVSLVMFAYWLGSLSRAGMIGGAVAVILLALILKNKLVDNWKYLFVLGIGFILIFIGMNSYGRGNIAGDLLSFGTETQMVMEGEESKWDLEDISTEGNFLTIETAEDKITVSLEDTSIKFFDEDENVLKYSFNKKSGEISFVKDKYKDHNFKFDPNKNILKWDYGQMVSNFKITKDGFYIIGHNSKGYKIKDDTEKWGFEDKERLGSSRGYIWSRSLPLLKETGILGYGADTYAIHFPQEDWVGKLIAFGKTTKIVDKPHNMYLQAAINTGIPSLLALLAIFVMYLIQSMKLYWTSNFDDTYKKVGVGILVAFVGYGVAGFFNDSVVSVAPIFWILLGIGISINMKLEKSNS